MGDLSWGLVIGVAVAAVIIYVPFMIFLPEWVGITGEKAREAHRAHQGETSPTETEETSPVSVATTDEEKK